MANRLARETSPYLRQHAENPVDWYPWGDEALTRARSEDRPILLSVGYSACHWCHVMAHESFENPEIAAQMNAHFVNVKLDREERPDLDQLYQGVVQLLGRGGGWPLTVFLTPDLRPIFGGTYFPAVDRYGMPGFPKVLGSIAEAWKTKRSELEGQAEQFREGLKHYAAFGLDSEPAKLRAEQVVEAGELLGSKFDAEHGGFGRGGPKFPNPMNVALTFRAHRRKPNEAMLSRALLTLKKMALGGIYDQLGGGFHRYSVDGTWTVPHFEKMLYDNAQLIHLYSEAQQLSPNPLWERVVDETVAYLLREMRAPGGAFYAAQDADSEGEEGKFFVWSEAELKALLTSQEWDVVRGRFDFPAGGNFEGERYVLQVKNDELKGDDVQIWREARAKLMAERSKRIAPGLDDKILAGWNGLLMRGLAFAGRVWKRPEWIEAARAMADFVLTQMRQTDGRLYRSHQQGAAKLEGMLEDYGDVAAGLCAVYQATFDEKYLNEAERIADIAYDLFWDEGRQAYRAAPKTQSDLFVETYALHDNAFPSGSSSLTEAQVALAALLSKPKHLERAALYIERMAAQLVENPFGYGHLWLAADAFLAGAACASIPTGTEWRAAVDHAFNPTLHVKHGDVATLCANFVCSLPFKTPEQLAVATSDVTKSHHAKTPA